MGVFSGGYKYYKQAAPALIIVYTVALLSVVIDRLIPQATQLFVDRVINPLFGAESKNTNSVFTAFLEPIPKNDFQTTLLALTLLLAVLVLARYVFHYSRWNVAHWFLRKASDRNRAAAYDHFLRQSPLLLSEYTSGDIFNYMTGDVDALMMMHLMHIPMLVLCLVGIPLSVYFVVRINPILAIPPLVIGVVVYIIATCYIKAMRKCHQAIRDASATLNTCIQENINGVRVVRSFAAEKIETDKFEQKNQKLYESYMATARKQAKYSTLFRFCAQSVNIICIILGIVLVATTGGEAMSVGEFTAFIAYTSQINGEIIAIATTIGAIQHNIVCGTRELNFIERPLLVESEQGAPEVPQNADIEFRNVKMEMNGKVALRGVSFTVRAGEKVGFMGKTGCGKSVIMKLLNRYYDVTDGEILIGGRNIKEYDVDSVRRHFSFVLQDVFLFSETVSKNIGFYDDAANAPKVKECAAIACADEFVSSLSDGYDTVVGERGLGLSGGQKQRLSIARAIYKDAPVFLLDDCTSALDYATEKKIVKNIFTERADKTVLIATHRANSAAYCDRIIYLDRGQVVESGTPQELIESRGMFYEVLASQREEE